ncbi:S24 family peptidase [Comamonas sp.]|uniref:S24 family peptidase n=1 Tax=Comamonas sp. TaxID=34028 RepID=UPI003D109171
MHEHQTQEWRIKRLAELAQREGGNAALGRRLGYKDGAYVGQMLRGDRVISEKTVMAVHSIPGYSGWFDTDDDSKRPTPIDLDNNPEYPAIRRVQFKLSAGASGFGVTYLDNEAPPIVFKREWYDERGFKPEKLFATGVRNGSMEPGLWDGDTVVVNTAQTEPKDGCVFAVNYEGELSIKRLVRDEGKWWLSSDNPDKRLYPRKACHSGVVLIGEIVHKQSERI